MVAPSAIGERERIPIELREYLVIECRGICCVCGDRSVQEIHHIKPVEEGGRTTYANLIAICGTCHSRIHSLRINRSLLRHSKAEWVSECQSALRKLLSGARETPSADSTARHFAALKDFGEFAAFRRRLAALMGNGCVFRNAFAVRSHRIRKTVDAGGDCWTDEKMTLIPFLRPARFHDIHIRGDGATDAASLQFQWRIEEGAPTTARTRPRLIRDDPCFKSYRVSWNPAVSPAVPIRLSYRYFWPATWNLQQDVYSYDVFGWSERVEYEFVLPVGWRVERVETSFIDVFGQEWPGCGDARPSGRGFLWRVRRLPMFTTAVIRHVARFAGRGCGHPATRV